MCTIGPVNFYMMVYKFDSREKIITLLAGICLEMDFVVNDEHLMRLVMVSTIISTHLHLFSSTLVYFKGYLRKRGCFDALCVLQLESGYSEEPVSSELKVLHGLCLRGDWDLVLQALAPLDEISPANFDKVNISPYSFQGLVPDHDVYNSLL